MSVTQLKDGRWIVQYPNPDKSKKPRLIREYFGRGPSARLKAGQRDADLALKQTRPKTVDHPGPLFYELAAEYRKAKPTTKTTRNADHTMSKVIFPVIGNMQAIMITHDTLSGFVETRLKTVKPSTVSRELTIIKAVLSWATKRHPPLIPYNPARDFHGPKFNDSIIVPPSHYELAALLKHAPDRLIRAIKFTYFTGLRPGSVELFSLRWDSVLWDRKVIRIVSAKKGGPGLRDIPIHPEFMDLLLKWWEADGSGFGPIIHYRGNAILSLFRIWSDTKKKAGITRRLRLYDFRHDFVTTAIENGVDIKTLSEIVGSNPETLRKYYQHVSGASRIQAIISIRPGNTTGNNQPNNHAK